MPVLECLLCGVRPEDLPGWRSDLVKLQEHLMDDHGVSREDLRAQTREETEEGYVWRLPDGRDWLKARYDGGC